MTDAVRALLVSYDIESARFESRSERNQFYRGLYGYRQTVRRNEKVYEYEKTGLLGDVPHIKVEDSVFIVARDRAQRFREYFEEWSGKVTVQYYRIMLEGEKTDKLTEE